MPILPVFGSVIDSCINIGPIEGFPAALPEVDCFPRFGPWNARVVRHNIFTVADDGKSLTTDCLRARHFLSSSSFERLLYRQKARSLSTPKLG